MAPNTTGSLVFICVAIVANGRSRRCCSNDCFVTYLSELVLKVWKCLKANGGTDIIEDIHEVWKLTRYMNQLILDREQAPGGEP